MKELLKRLCWEEEGQDLTEYALLMVMVSLVAIAAIKTFGVEVSQLFSSTARHVSRAGHHSTTDALFISI